MKDVLIDRIGDTINGIYKHVEVQDDGRVFLYQHNYKDGKAESQLIILWEDDMEKLFPVLQEQRSKMASRT